MRKKAIFGYSLIGLFSVLSGMSYFVLCTATGLSWYLNQNISDTDSAISISEVANGLNGNCKIIGLKYVTPSYQVEISELELSWNPLAVLRQEIDITSFSGENVSFRAIQTDWLVASSKGFQPPFALKIDQGSIKQFSMKLSGSYSESIQHVKFEQVYLDESFYANKMIVTLENGGAFELSGKAGFRSTDVVNLTTKATLTIPDTGKVLSSHGTIVGTPEQLKFLQNINPPYASRVIGSVDNVLTNPYWQFSVNVHSLNGNIINPRLNVDAIQGELYGIGSLDNLKLTGDLTLEDSLSRRWHLSLTSTYNTQNTVFDITSTLPGKSSQARIEFKGQWNHFNNTQFPRSISVTGKLSNLEWPINQDSNIQIRQGDFNFEGLTLRSEFTAEDIKLTSIGTHLTKLRIDTTAETDKHIALSGKARTTDGSIQFSGNLKKRDLGYRIANLSMTGKNFALVRKPNAHIIISPDITLSRSNQSIQSNGVIKVPTANIQLQAVAETYHQFVTLFLTKSQPGVKAAQSIDQLNLKFGKSVWMHGYGLNAHVTGDLSLVNLTDKTLIADGKLNILRGNYKNHNKQFAVSGGSLNFDKKQLDNPDLELKIVQKHNAGSTPETLKGPLQSLHTAQENAPINDLSQQQIKQVALNEK